MVGLDLPALVGLEPDLFEREPLGVRPPPDRHEHRSASIVSAAPPLAGSTVSVTLSPFTFAPVTLVPGGTRSPAS